MSIGTFAVVDVETTGLFPGHHRVAEIGVVKVNRNGEVVDRWETLVNPERDLGKQSIHGIQSAELLDAPTFDQLAPTLSNILSGSVLVAHNLSFDARFLKHEFHRAGYPLPAPYLDGLCTMRLAHHYVSGAGRSLRDCCDSFGIQMGQAHCAGDDAHAAAQLLGRYIDLDPQLRSWDVLLTAGKSVRWKNHQAIAPVSPVLRRPAGYVEPHFLERIVVRLPEFSGPAEHEQYLALLDRALLDRRVSVTEGNQLVQAADDLGIGRMAAIDLHSTYLTALITAAWHDGVITAEEEQDLRLVCEMLGLPQDLVSTGISAPPPPMGCTAAERSPKEHNPGLDQGDMIVLTGDMTYPRPELEDEIRSAGYIAHSGVTKKVKLLVAADPDSQSGKARKARTYGIPVVGEAYLLQLLGL